MTTASGEVIATRRPVMWFRLIAATCCLLLCQQRATSFCSTVISVCCQMLKSSLPVQDQRVANGAGEKSRTPDLRITNALLYQLSYAGVAHDPWALASCAF